MEITNTDKTPDLTEAATSFAALGSEQRLGVLKILVRAGPDGLSIGELGKRSGVTVPADFELVLPVDDRSIIALFSPNEAPPSLSLSIASRESITTAAILNCI